MRFENKSTGDVLELPPPGRFGCSTIRLNGKIIARVRYSDDDGGYMELENGTRLNNLGESRAYIFALLREAGAFPVVTPERARVL